MTNSARSLTLSQQARLLLAEAGSAGDIPSLPIGPACRWALAASRALAGDPGRGSGG